VPKLPRSPELESKNLLKRGGTEEAEESGNCQKCQKCRNWKNRNF
jgi:hypothetical protein